MTDKTVADLVDLAIEKKPEDFKSTFDELMLDKIASALETKRAEVAKAYFDTEAQEEQPAPEEQDGQNTETNA